MQKSYFYPIAIKADPESFYDSDLSDLLKKSLTAEQRKIYERIKLENAKKLQNNRKSYDISRRADPNTPLSDFPALAEKMYIIFEKTQDRGINTLEQLERFLKNIIETQSGGFQVKLPNTNKGNFYVTHARYFVEGDVIVSATNASNNGQLREPCLKIIEALEIAPSLGYANFAFKPSPISLELDKRFMLAPSSAKYGSAQPAP